MLYTLAFIAVIGIIFIFKMVRIVPQQQAWIVERFGKFESKLEPGLNLLVPMVQVVAYKHTLKEVALDVHEQTAITRDNVTVILDGVIYLKIMDPVAASYGVSDPIYAVTQLAQTTMRSELGKLSMDESFEERERLNANIVTAINQAAHNWGIQCMRYEIKNISPPTTVLKAMELQVAAERQKRALILESEGKRQSQINIAEADKQQQVLRSEGRMIEQVNNAKGEAEAIVAVAEANARGIRAVAQAILDQGGSEAVAMKLAEEYVQAFGKLAKEGTTILLPSNAGDAGSMVVQALSIFDTIRSQRNVAHTSPWQQPNS